MDVVSEEVLRAKRIRIRIRIEEEEEGISSADEDAVKGKLRQGVDSVSRVGWAQKIEYFLCEGVGCSGTVQIWGLWRCET